MEINKSLTFDYKQNDNTTTSIKRDIKARKIIISLNHQLENPKKEEGRESSNQKIKNSNKVNQQKTQRSTINTNKN